MSTGKNTVILSRRKFLAAAGKTVLGLGMAQCSRSSVAVPKRDSIKEELISWPVHELARGIRAKAFSAIELVRAYLQRIEQVNPWLNAVVALNAEQALYQAQLADTILAQGKSLGPLHGIPMTIKDSLDTKSVKTSWGVPVRAGFIPKRDAAVVARLKSAGAILLGKTNTPELTLSFESNSPVYGATNNPYDVQRTAGGSSGGSAAIVAAMGSPFDIGSDTGGSVRVPAHFCGVCGLRPTSGRVPRTGNAVPPGGLLDRLTAIGPIARSAADLELITQIITGPDGQDPSVHRKPPISTGRIRLSSLRGVYHLDNGICSPSPETEQTIRNVVNLLTQAGVEFVQRKPPGIEQTLELFVSLMNWGDGALRRTLLKRASAVDVAPAVQAPTELTKETRQLLRWWKRFRTRMGTFMDSYDLLLCPVNAYPAISHGKALDKIDAFSYTMTYSLTDWPAAVVRAGTSEDGLPIGVQIVAAPWREDIVLGVAKHLERHFGGWQYPEL